MCWFVLDLGVCFIQFSSTGVYWAPTKGPVTSGVRDGAGGKAGRILQVKIRSVARAQAAHHLCYRKQINLHATKKGLGLPVGSGRAPCKR